MTSRKSGLHTATMKIDTISTVNVEPLIDSGIFIANKPRLPVPVSSQALHKDKGEERAAEGNPYLKIRYLYLAGENKAV